MAAAQALRSRVITNLSHNRIGHGIDEEREHGRGHDLPLRQAQNIRKIEQKEEVEEHILRTDHCVTDPVAHTVRHACLFDPHSSAMAAQLLTVYTLERVTA
jgi:hypothetical protein